MIQLSLCTLKAWKIDKMIIKSIQTNCERRNKDKKYEVSTLEAIFARFDPMVSRKADVVKRVPRRRRFLAAHALDKHKRLEVCLASRKVLEVIDVVPLGCSRMEVRLCELLLKVFFIVEGVDGNVGARIFV